MNPDFPSFYSDPRESVKRLTAIVILLAVVSFAVISFEVASYFLISSESSRNTLKIHKYQQVRDESPSLLDLERQYMNSVRQMELVNLAYGTNRSLISVLNILEEHIDQHSVVEKIIFDAGKKHALVYVKSVYPRELETSITSNEIEEKLKIAILSKKTARQSPYKVVYELRAAL